jgi:hypothetical protein
MAGRIRRRTSPSPKGSITFAHRRRSAMRNGRLRSNVAKLSWSRSCRGRSLRSRALFHMGARGLLALRAVQEPHRRARVVGSRLASFPFQAPYRRPWASHPCVHGPSLLAGGGNPGARPSRLRWLWGARVPYAPDQRIEPRFHHATRRIAPGIGVSICAAGVPLGCERAAGPYSISLSFWPSLASVPYAR